MKTCINEPPEQKLQLKLNEEPFVFEPMPIVEPEAELTAPVTMLKLVPVRSVVWQLNSLKLFLFQLIINFGKLSK